MSETIKEQLPEPIQRAINDFFVWWVGSENYENTLDNITQDALFHLKETDGQHAGDYFFLIRGLKDLLMKLKPYVNE